MKKILKANGEKNFYMAGRSGRPLSLMMKKRRDSVTVPLSRLADFVYLRIRDLEREFHGGSARSRWRIHRIIFLRGVYEFIWSRFEIPDFFDMRDLFW